MSRTLALESDRRTRNPPPGIQNVAPDLAALGVLALCVLVLHRDGLFGGPAFYELDTRLFYYPLTQWVAQQLQAGTFPLWLPGIFTGYPIFADGELGLAYLPQLALLYLLPTPQAMVWLRALHAFLAGAFTYLYLRTARLGPLPSLGGALIFAFGSFLTAQMHHENVVRSSVWLPAVLTCAERSVFPSDRSAFRVPRSALVWSALGALAFSQAALGLHPQPVLMLTLALLSYSVFRALVPTRNTERGTPNAFLTGMAITVGGLALAAVQWLPLGEWALVSSRRGGVAYEFASAFGLAPENMPSIVFPYFFRMSDAATWWSLWQHWEIELYVGIPTLALVIVGVVCSRRAEVLYFVPLGIVALLIAMAGYASPLNLHELLWSLPGFSFLRAPGRFTYLVVFACACLAAFGLQALTQRRLRPAVALLGGLPPVVALAALLAFLPNWRAWLQEDQVRALDFVTARYLATRAQYPIDPHLVVNGLLSSLDLANPKTAWSLGLLGITALCFVAWVGVGPRRAYLGQSLFVALLAIDLLAFASDFHPRAPLASLTPTLPAGITPGTRALLRDAADVPEVEPDQLLAAGVSTVQGYSSLPSQRFVELELATSVQPSLFDLWSAPFVVEPARPPDLHEVDGVRFRARHPLAAGFGGARPSVFKVPSELDSIRALRLIGTLSYAFEARQNQVVATVTLDETRTLPLRAGEELAERAYDRPSLSGLVRHQRARVALDFVEATPEGEEYIGHLYVAEVQLGSHERVRSIAITPTDPRVLVELYGIALIDASGTARSLDMANLDGFRRAGVQVVHNTRALPRAYVLPRPQAFSPARHPTLTTTQLVASPDNDPHSMLLIEGDPSMPADTSGSVALVSATRVDDIGPNVVRVTATAEHPSYLVLGDFYHRGWTARVDGQPTRVLIANALFRAVAIDPGVHEVEFRFEPLSHLIGAAISVLSLVIVLAVLVAGSRTAR